MKYRSCELSYSLRATSRLYYSLYSPNTNRETYKSTRPTRQPNQPTSEITPFYSEQTKKQNKTNKTNNITHSITLYRPAHRPLTVPSVVRRINQEPAQGHYCKQSQILDTVTDWSAYGIHLDNLRQSCEENRYCTSWKSFVSTYSERPVELTRHIFNIQ